MSAPGPGLTKLLDLRAKTLAELEAKKDTDDAPGLLHKVEQIDGQIEKFQSFSTKAKGEEYVGEDKEFGFRRDLWMKGQKPQMPAKPKPDKSLSKEEALKRDQEYLASLSKYKKDLEEWEARPHQQDTITKYDRTPEEQQKSELEVSESGTMQTKDGNVMQGKKGYVVDPKTGKLHYFEETREEVEVEVDDPTTGGKKKIKQLQIKHHTTPLSGEDVAGAGDIEFKNGVIESISNSSGHYKPKAVQLIQTLEELLKQGALLDKTYEVIDPKTGKGKPLEGTLKDLYTKMEDAERRVWSQLDQWHKLKAQIDAKQAKKEDCETELKEFDELSEQLKPDTDLIARAAEMLKKHHAAPSNRLRDVKVSFSELKDSMSGAEVKKVVTTDSTAKDFLMTGGGDVTSGGQTTTMEDKKKAKKALHKQLKEALAKRKAVLDEQAEKLSAELPDKLAKIKKIPDLIVSLEEIYVERAEKLTEREKKELQAGIARLKESLNNPKTYDDKAMTKLIEELEDRKLEEQRRILESELQGDDDDDDEESSQSPGGDDMDKFGEMMIKDPDSTYLSIRAKDLAKRTGQSLEDIFEQAMGRKPVKKAPEKLDDMQKFGEMMIKDPRSTYLSIRAQDLAEQTGQSLKEIFEQAMGRKPKLQ
jgi:hypothetical protein